MDFLGVNKFIKKYLSNDENFLIELEENFKIKKIISGEVLDTKHFSYYINDGLIASDINLENFVFTFENNNKENKLFFDYTFSFIIDYFAFYDTGCSNQKFYVVEDSELVCIEYNQLINILEKYNLSVKFEQILIEFEKNKIKRELYNKMLKLDF